MCGIRGETRRCIAVATLGQPTEEGFEEDEEDEGRERVTLDSAAADGDRISEDVGGAVEDDACADIRIDVGNSGEGILGETKVVHDTEKV